MTVTITHAKVSSGTVNDNVEVDLADWNDDHVITNLTAADVTFTATGGISSNTVQTAIAEIDSETVKTADLAAVALSGSGSDIASGNMGLTTLTITGGVASSSTTTGALIVGGGVGVAGALNVGGNIIGSEIFAGAASFAYGVRGLYSIASGTNASYMFWGNATNNERARLQVTDSRQLYFSLDNGATGHLLVTTTNANIPMTTASTSTTTGALTVGGGVGIAGALNVGGAINIAGVASTFGPGGTGAATPQMLLNAGSASGGAGAFSFAKNSVLKWNITQLSAAGGTSDDLLFFSTGTAGLALTIGYNNGALLLLGPTGGIGYGTGAGGTVTQATNRTTGVTLNKVSGAITLFSQVNTAISQATAQSFTVTNSAVAATDTIIVSQKSGTDKYEIFVTNVAAGSFQITNYAVAGTTNEAPVFNFTVIKGVTS